jgi:hypothetical protein
MAPADAQCPPDSIGRLAVQILHPGGLSSDQPLHLRSGEVARQTPELKGYWIHTGPSWFPEAAVRKVKPTADCVRFTQVDVYPARLADSKCYWVLKFDAEPTCWALRVVSEPSNYPFRVKPNLLRQKITGNPDWNVEKNLPRNSLAKVEIFDRDGSKVLLAIPDVEFGAPRDVEKSELLKYIVPEDAQDRPVQDDAVRAVRKRYSPPALGELQKIHLEVVKEGQP